MGIEGVVLRVQETVGSSDRVRLIRAFGTSTLLLGIGYIMLKIIVISRIFQWTAKLPTELAQNP